MLSKGNKPANKKNKSRTIMLHECLLLGPQLVDVHAVLDLVEVGVLLHEANQLPSEIGFGCKG